MKAILGLSLFLLGSFVSAEVTYLDLDPIEEKGKERELFWRRGNTAAIRQGDWKLITLKREPAFLFNVSADPKETQNVIAAGPGRTEELNGLLSEWDANLPEPRWRKKASDSYDQSLLKCWDDE